MWKELTHKLTDTCINAFSEEVEVHHSGTPETIDKVRGVYDATYQQVDLQTGAVISSNAPMVEIAISSLSKTIKTTAKIKARGVLYRIKELQPDDSGAVKILLARS